MIWVDFTIYFSDTRLYISMISLTQLLSTTPFMCVVFGVRNLWLEVDISVVLDREGVFGMGKIGYMTTLCCIIFGRLI